MAQRTAHAADRLRRGLDDDAAAGPACRSPTLAARRRRARTRTRCWCDSLQPSGVLRAGHADAATRSHDQRSLLALQVNGADLSLDHGYPARIIVPGAARRAQHEVGGDADVRRSALTRARYGASPLHLLAHLALLPLARLGAAAAARDPRRARRGRAVADRRRHPARPDPAAGSTRRSTALARRRCAAGGQPRARPARACRCCCCWRSSSDHRVQGRAAPTPASRGATSTGYCDALAAGHRRAVRALRRGLPRAAGPGRVEALTHAVGQPGDRDPAGRIVDGDRVGLAHRGEAAQRSRARPGCELHELVRARERDPQPAAAAVDRRSRMALRRAARRGA